MQAEDVKAYLKDNPHFFEENASFLADIHLPSPHGEGAISLAERQQLAQRDKIEALEERFAELVVNAKENDAIANKIHAFNLALHKAATFDAVEQLISTDLPEQFDLTDTYLRLWAQPEETATGAHLVFSPIPEATKAWILTLTNPFCDVPPEAVTADWFLERAASIAVIPLRDGDIFGVLALASTDKNRFFPEMGTDFLVKMGEIIGAALTRYLDR
jgi:uncharacterized protein